MSITDILLLPFLCGTAFLTAGFIQFKFPPKKINPIYGYRTNLSKKSQRNWDFAQRYSAKLMMISGLIQLLFSFSGWLYNPGLEYDLFIGMVLLLMTAITLLVLTQTELRRFEERKE